MKYACGMLVVLAVVAPPDACAQPKVRAGLPPTPPAGIPVGRGPARVGGMWAGPWFGFGGYPLAPFAPMPFYPWPVSTVSVFLQSPLVYSPPVVINQPVVVIRDRAAGFFEDEDVIRFMPRPRNPAPDPPRLPPEQRLSLPRPVPRVEAIPAPKESRPIAKLPPSRSDRLLARGRESFVLQMYGLAERFFEQATEIPPEDPQAWFCLAQAQFARAEYQEAVRSVTTGLRMQPEWVRSPFRAGDLYGPNAADFQNHLSRLEETLSRFPRDRFLLFLYGYELWFSGHRDEARLQFQRAVEAGADAGLIQLFLNAPMPVTIARNITR